MKCFACHSEIQEGIGQCKHCGFPMFFPVFQVMEDTQEKSVLAGADIPAGAGRRYLRDRLLDLEIKLLTHYYQLEDHFLIPDHSNEEVLAKGEELSYDKIKWSEISFQCIESMETLPLELILQQGKRIKKYKVLVKKPKVSGCWNVGVILKPAFKIQVVLGSRVDFQYSGEIPLVF